MKKINQDLTVTETSFEHSLIIGTSRMSEFDGPYDRIVECFGLPTVLDDPDKVQVEWLVLTPDGVAIIYDYKEEYNNYTAVTDWHIGGHNKASAQWVLEVLTYK